MKTIEIIGKRKPREKHFLKENGIIEAQLYNQDIHFLKNGRYEEIDNTLIKKENSFVNKNNSYNAIFSTDMNKYIYRMEKDNHYIEFSLNKFDCCNIEISNNSKYSSNLTYHNILKNIDLNYEIVSSMVKENIVLLKKENALDDLVYNIKTDLTFKIERDGSISAKYDGHLIFKFDLPYMIDSKGNKNNKISYNLIKDEDMYQLIIFTDKKWLESDIEYPVIIDPTITNYGNDSSVIDTYIYPNDTNVSRGSLDYLKIGVEKVNNSDITNRSLLKFQLPTIGTGSQVIEAKLALYYYPYITTESIEEIINVHCITKDWTENGANWANMNNAYNPRVEGVLNFLCSYYLDENGNPTTGACMIDITQLVQKWYTSTPNYGILLKLANEKYNKDIIPKFFSKDYNSTSGNNPKPVLVISYRNQNGLENYMNYETHSFGKANIYHNSYNGNLTTIYNLGTTSPGKLPATLKLIYNTNDVVLNKNRGFGIGYKFNLNQTIKEVVIDDKTYLEYEDEDGTLHYFLSEKKTLDSDGNEVIQNEENTYYDEDGLDLKIRKYDEKFVLIDKNNNEMKFTKYNNVGYFTEIKDVSGNINSISYDDEYKKILSIKDANENTINIIYNDNSINIVSPTETVILSLLNEKILSSINYSNDNILIASNEYYLMTSLTNVSGKKIEYEYYEEIPYKLKKVTEYGLDNSLGNNYTTIYGFNSTTFIDSKGKRKVITFNSYGNPESSSIMKEENDIINAYGSKSTYGKMVQEDNLDLDKNKLLSSQVPIKYVKNLLTNTSFENDDIIFNTFETGHCYISDEYSNTGLKSLRFEALYAFLEANISKELDVEKGKYYTFSVYIKKGMIGTYTFLRMNYETEDGRIAEIESEKVMPTDEFERIDLTMYYPSDAKGNLNIQICLDGRGITFIDDIQLEEGEVANNYNMIENSDFSSGMNDWSLYSIKYDVSDIFKVVDVKNQKALKINMLTDNQTEIEKTFNVNGKKGDNFTLSFWYKNTGLIGKELFDIDTKNIVSMIFYPTDTEIVGDLIENYSLNSNENDWQYFICNFASDYDFSKFKLSIDQEINGNEFYITNINLFKDVRSVRYSYDENGNIISKKNLNEKNTNYKYDKNNELIKITDMKGKIFCYEYDNLVTDRVLRGISETGISNEIIYNSQSNPIITRIVDRGIMLKPQDGEYIIRLKGTSKIFRLINNLIAVSDDYHSHDKWKLEKVTIDSKDYYKIYHSLINEKYLTISNNNIILASYQNDNSLFELITQDNGSYLLKNKATLKYIKTENNNFILANLVEYDYNFQFYFETNENPIFIENSAEYTEDGRFITKIIDTNLNEIKYEINFENNKIKSITNPKNQCINYNYNNKNQLESVVLNGRKIGYEYNKDNTLSKITQIARVYNFEYDKFTNVNRILIGNNILIENEYEKNNGNLKAISYGNNQSIYYEYDEFNRIKQLRKNDDTFNYKYNSNGDLTKIISNDNIFKFKYDISKRLYKYDENNFSIKYIYDDNNNIIEKEYVLDNKIYIINNILNDDDALIKLSVDSNEFNYEYDGLGRLVSSNINNKNIINYKYKENGNRTSTMLKSIMNNNDIYNYDYDKLGNIIKIYHNNLLENEYYYDEYNELIKENNYILNKTIKYYYDEYGNILYKRFFEIKTDHILSEIKYEYSNEELKDQLTKFEDELITYDKLGNPITIGENIKLTWINGRQLNSIVNESKTITYKYNVDGIRTEKNVNDLSTKYYLEGKNIIFEKTLENVIYYIRNSVGGLIGFKYNDELYYYQKNKHDDIIGILDSSYNFVAKYEYDAWGNILSIVDSNGNDISNNNKHIANINPYRYRSYYYDKDTNLYYLNSRYYNPRWGRFINIDGIINCGDIILGNLYSYCSNNPINMIDSNGKRSLFIPIGTTEFIKAAYKLKKVIKKTMTKAAAFISSKLAGTFLPLTSNLFDNSLHKNPKDVHYESDSDFASAIKQSTSFKNKMNEVKSALENGQDITTTTLLEFPLKETDLFFSLHKTTLDVTPTLDRSVVHVKISDKYDFGNINNVTNPFALLINDVGIYLQSNDITHIYNFEVEFDYSLYPTFVSEVPYTWVSAE